MNPSNNLGKNLGFRKLNYNLGQNFGCVNLAKNSGKNPCKNLGNGYLGNNLGKILG